MRLIFVRHADPDYEHDSLTPIGFSEAESLAKRFPSFHGKHLYCSPLGRAQTTAKIATGSRADELVLLPWLREFDPTIFYNGREKIIWDILPQDMAKDPLMFDPFHWMECNLYKDAKQLPEKYKACTEGIDAILKEHGYERDGLFYKVNESNDDTLVFFCHFGVESLIISHLINCSPCTLWMNFVSAPSGVCIVNTEERRKGIALWRVEEFGGTEHLYADKKSPSFAARFCSRFENDERHD